MTWASGEGGAKPRRPFYPSTPQDSVALAEEAEAILAEAWPADPRKLLALAGPGRPDLATMLLYRACHRGENGAFLGRLATMPVGPAPIRILIVPGFLFAEHPELAIDGKLIRDIARRLGAEAEIADVDSRGLSDANGKRLAARLVEGEQRPTWMFSLSKGTSDARAALHHLGGWPRGLAGWVDLSGIFSGTPIADWWTDETVRRWLVKAFFGVNNLPFGTLQEMRRDAPIWRRPVTPPSPDRLIHVLGFPPPWRVEPRMLRNYRRLLAAFGPNDGFTPLVDAFDYPGRIYPIWGADHLMRLPDLAGVIYRIVHMAAAVESGNTRTSPWKEPCNASLAESHALPPHVLDADPPVARRADLSSGARADTYP